MEDDPDQCRQSDVVQFPNPAFDYGSHLINTVPALKSRQETMADVLYDFGNVFEGLSSSFIYRRWTRC